MLANKNQIEESQRWRQIENKIININLNEKSVERVHQRFIQVGPKQFVYLCLKQFSLESFTKIRLELLSDQPMNLQKSNKAFTQSELKNFHPNIFQVQLTIFKSFTNTIHKRTTLLNKKFNHNINYNTSLTSFFWSFNATKILVKSKHKNNESRKKIEGFLFRISVQNKMRRYLLYIEKI